jgi:hypothetical protein
LIASRGIAVVPAEPENTLANLIEKVNLLTGNELWAVFRKNCGYRHEREPK